MPSRHVPRRRHVDLGHELLSLRDMISPSDSSASVSPHDGAVVLAHGKFRIDINALRAVSVVAVLGYHLKIPGFAGGFTGVDVFFVITGYLMTRVVLASIAADGFSFWSFMMQRMRRIYPALAVVVVVTAVAGWFVTLPGEYMRHLRQACYALLALSNFAFDADNGYFASAAQTKPLLHTWSLAIEWQFYIWMPLATVVVCRGVSLLRDRLALITVFFAVTALISLAWCLWQSQSDALGSAFFSLRARAWEPLAGGLIAAYEFRSLTEGRPRRQWPPTAAYAGWLIIVTCIIYPLPEKQWPGLLTLAPVFGALLVIGSSQQTLGGGLLGWSTLQRLGDWSYSIYLWHWPIWVFSLTWLSFRGYETSVVVKASILFASLMAGAASYYLVEQPIRSHRDYWTERRLVTISAVGFFALLTFTATAFLKHGFPSRLPEYLLAAEEARRNGTPRDECFRNSNSIKKAAELYCSFGRDRSSAKLSAILWGDSIANQYLEPISSAAQINDIHGFIATQSACKPFIATSSSSSNSESPCQRFNRSTLDFILGNGQPSIVIIGGNWDDTIELSPLIDRLIKARKTVILIMPLVRVGFDVPQQWMANQVRAGRALNDWKVLADPSLTMSGLRSEISAILGQYKGNPRLVAVDPLPTICEGEHCYLVRSGKSNFRDSIHISDVTSMQYLHLFDDAFRYALQASD